MMAATQKSIDRSMQVINESLQLSETSKKADTRISRYDVAVSQVRALIDSYPHWPDAAQWQQLHKRLMDERPQFVRRTVEMHITDGIAKIDECKTAKTRENRTAKLIESLDTFKQSGCDSVWLSEQIAILQERQAK